MALPIIEGLPASYRYKFLYKRGDYFYYIDSASPLRLPERSTTDPYLAFPSEVFPPRLVKGTANTSTRNTGTLPSSAGPGFSPDPRMVYLVSDNSIIYSMDPGEQVEAVDGMVIVTNPEAGGQNKKFGMGNDPNVNTKNMKMYYAVPSIMNSNSYINLQAAGGEQGNSYMQDQENQPLWYQADGTIPINNQDEPALSTSSPDVSTIINWSKQTTRNINKKFPYKYQDFVYCKWWQKIPNNYMVTLRRYGLPVNDSVGFDSEADESAASQSSDSKKKVGGNKNNFSPVATAVTWLGEDTGNKISAILGPITSGLKWKDVKADVWKVETNVSYGDATDPFPGVSKVLGLFTEGRTNAVSAPPVPPDPYNNGPYANKVEGGVVTVIDSVKARERGLEFKHEIKLVFEYVARSIGQINTKAAMLDVMANMLLLTTSSATFWGGMNRFMPFQGRGTQPFLGGMAGMSAWENGDPMGFINAVGSQLMKSLGSLADIWNSLSDNPEKGLKSIAAGGASAYMKSTSQPTRAQVTGLHSLLTGKEVGEWHLTIGNPMNPMMMIGNLICTGITLEFNEELGPDDFPTEMKATVTLEHGMPRDKSRIESMFNKGQGRIYSLPKGYEASLSSNNVTEVDAATGKKSKTKANPSNVDTSTGRNKGNRSPLLGDPAVADKLLGSVTKTTVQNASGAVYVNGVAFNKPKG